MKAVLKSSCRSDGNAYLLVAVRGVVGVEGLQVRVQSSAGWELPCEWYAMREDADGADIVVRTALVYAGKNVLSISAPQSEGMREEAILTVDSNRVKWESRLVYRLRSDLANEMRRIGDADQHERVNIVLTEAFDDGHERIMHGFAWLSDNDGAPIEFSCLGEQGEPADWVPIQMSDSMRVSHLSSGLDVREVHFSVRVPADQSLITLIAADSSGSQRRGFYSVSPSRIKNMLGEGGNRAKDASRDEGYAAWAAKHQATAGYLEKQRRLSETMPLVDVVLPIDGAPADALLRTVESIKAQSYQRWRLVLVDTCGGECETRGLVGELKESDPRITSWDLLDGPMGKDGNAGEKAPFECAIEPDVVLDPSALFEFVGTADHFPDDGAFYCDEDVLAKPGQFAQPFFKPDFSIDLLRSYNYIGRVLFVRAGLFGGLGELAQGADDGARAYRRALCAAELAGSIRHVRVVLAHESLPEKGAPSRLAARNGDGSTAADASLEAVRGHLSRIGLDCEVTPAPWQGVQRVRYAVKGRPLVSIVIPNKDCASMLGTCIRSITGKSTYDNFEVIVVENNSTEQATFGFYEEIQTEDPRVKVVTWDGSFNFSKIVNFGVSCSKGEYVVLLNNDTEVISPTWLEAMLGLCQREDVGIAGARLLFADGTLQHAGALVTDKGSGAFHAFWGLPGSNPCYYLFAAVTRDCSIVTAACMMTPRKLYDEVGGFEEELTVAYNDVDYCLKVRELGLQVVYEPSAELYHYESISRGYDWFNKEKVVRLYQEESYLHRKWARFYTEGDPFFHPALETEYYRLKEKA